MVQVTNFDELLEHSYIQTQRNTEEMDRFAYLGEYIFGFDLDDPDMSGEFAKFAVLMCEAINGGSEALRGFHQSSRRRYHWFLAMTQMPFFIDRIECGTSIRYPWWDQGHRNEFFTLQSCGLYFDEDQWDDQKFTLNQWKAFIAAVVKFGRKELHPENLELLR